MDQNNENIQTNKKKINFSQYMKVAAFLSFEILAILAFGLGNSFVFFASLSLVLMVISALVCFRQINKNGFVDFLFFIFPVLIYGLLIALSNFNQDEMFNLRGLQAFVPLGLVAISLTGYFLSLNNKFNINLILIVIYSSIALLSLINLFATLINYAPFHTILYKNKYIYYNGAPSSTPVGEMAYCLMGFKMSEVSIRYFALFPSVLISSFIPLLFIKYKEEKKLFIMFLSYGFLGLVSLILTPTKMLLLTDVLLVLVLLGLVLIFKGIIKKKPLKIFAIVVAVLFVLGLIFMYFNAQAVPNGMKTFVSKSALLTRLFTTNRVVRPFNAILDGLLQGKIFGTPTWGTVHEYDYNGTPFSGSWIFDNFIVGGLFGGIFFLAILVLGFRQLITYYQKSKDDTFSKVGMISFIVAFFTYSMINFESKPFIFNDSLSPMFESGIFMICLFFFAYVTGKNQIETPTTEEKKETEYEQVI